MAITTNVAARTDRPGRGIPAMLAAKLTPFAGILVFLAVWQAAVAVLKVPAYLLPPPTEIFRTFFSELPRILHHGWFTT